MRKLSQKKKEQKPCFHEEEIEMVRNLPEAEELQQINQEENNPAGSVEQFSLDGQLSLQHQPLLTQEKHKPI